MDDLPILGIAMGDPAGVGPEVVVKSISRAKEARLVVFGIPAILRSAANVAGIALDFREVPSPKDATFLPGTLDIVPIPGDPREIGPGVVSAEAGRIAAASLLTAARACMTGAVGAIVTAPTHKTSLRAAGIHAEGQTQMLGQLWGLRSYGMMAVGAGLRVLLLTRHMSLRQALDSVSTIQVLEHLRMLDETLARIGLVNRRIAVAGFNPHAGEGGLFGTEDDTLLAPAVHEARNLGMDVKGPFPADSIFGRAARGEFDGVLALYHDQGLIPVKTIAFDTAVTVLTGSPYLRVSVIHGAGFDRAGQNRANPENMIAAIRHAAEWAPRWNAHVKS